MKTWETIWKSTVHVYSIVRSAKYKSLDTERVNVKHSRK